MRALLLMALLMVGAAANAAVTGPGAYKIGGVAVDVAAKTPVAARAAAFREAQRLAWPQLWARLTGDTAANAPRLTDGTIESMVAGVEIESERFSATRYIGRLAIVFDRARAAGYLGGASGTQAPPMLLLAVTIDGGARTLYQTKTPWVAAWVRFREAASALDYVIPAGSAGDNVVLTAYQARRSDRQLWRNVLNRFRAVDVVTAEAIVTRSYPGGPVGVLAIARHGPDAIEMGRVSLRAGSAAALDATLDEAARQVDGIYARALRDGRMKREPGLITELEPLLAGAPDIGGTTSAATIGGVEASVVTPDAASWATTEATLRGTPTVTGVTLTSLSLGGTSRLVIRFGDSRAMLDYQLDQRGLRLAVGDAGLVLRRRLPGDVPVPRPPSQAEIDAAAAAAAGLPVAAPPDLAAPASTGGTTAATAPRQPVTARPTPPAPSPEAPAAPRGPRATVVPPAQRPPPAAPPRTTAPVDLLPPPR